jgi:pimeloyl-ACP methyl ester carboxylesterase
MSEALIDPQLPTETSFDLAGQTITAKAWGNPNGEPTLALHGWLDNANTFDRLAPLLPELHLIAIDFAGHGLSAHRPPRVHYQSLLDVQDALDVTRALGWERFNVIGHSMGAAVGSELGGLFPGCIAKAIHIDGYIHHEGDAVEDITANTEAIEQMLSAAQKCPPIYLSLDGMAERVTQAADQSFSPARTLVARGHKHAGSGYTWRTDPRIRFRTPGRYTNAQIDELMRRSDFPALLIVANSGDEWFRPGIGRRQQQHPNLQVEYLDGGHHLHLADTVGEVAALVRDFLGLD